SDNSNSAVAIARQDRFGVTFGRQQPVTDPSPRFGYPSESGPYARFGRGHATKHGETKRPSTLAADSRPAASWVAGDNVLGSLTIFSHGRGKNSQVPAIAGELMCGYLTISHGL